MTTTVSGFLGGAFELGIAPFTSLVSPSSTTPACSPCPRHQPGLLSLPTPPAHAPSSAEASLSVVAPPQLMSTGRRTRTRRCTAPLMPWTPLSSLRVRCAAVTPGYPAYES